MKLINRLYKGPRDDFINSLFLGAIRNEDDDFNKLMLIGKYSIQNKQAVDILEKLEKSPNRELCKDLISQLEDISLKERNHDKIIELDDIFQYSFFLNKKSYLKVSKIKEEGI